MEMNYLRVGGKFKLSKKLGEGTFGTLYSGFNMQTKEEVAKEVGREAGRCMGRLGGPGRQNQRPAGHRGRSAAGRTRVLRPGSR